LLIRIIAVAKKAQNWTAEAETDFLKRIQNCAKIETALISPFDENSFEVEKSKEMEGEKILAKINSDDFVIACERIGRNLNSEEFAKKLGELRDTSKKVVFIIGGSNGLSSEVLERADLQISFSDLTFPHELFRIMLLEQVYRAITILENRKYHK